MFLDLLAENCNHDFDYHNNHEIYFLKYLPPPLAQRLGSYNPRPGHSIFFRKGNREKKQTNVMRKANCKRINLQKVALIDKIAQTFDAVCGSILMKNCCTSDVSTVSCKVWSQKRDLKWNSSGVASQDLWTCIVYQLGGQRGVKTNVKEAVYIPTRTHVQPDEERKQSSQCPNSPCLVKTEF